MKRKLLIVGIIIGIVAVLIVVSFVLYLGRSGKVTPTANSSATPAPSATPSASPTATPTPENPIDTANEKQIAALYDQPIIKALPKYTPHWSLEYRGLDNHQYQVTARVFVRPGQNADAVLAAQKPYIQDFIKQTGQPPDTVAVKYIAQPLESD